MLLESRNMIGEVDFARCEVWRNQWSRIPWLSTAFLRGISLSLFILILHWFLDSNSWEKKLFCVSCHLTALMTACVTVSLKAPLITLCQQNLAISDSDVQFHLWLDWNLSLWSSWVEVQATQYQFVKLPQITNDVFLISSKWLKVARCCPWVHNPYSGLPSFRGQLKSLNF